MYIYTHIKDTVKPNNSTHHTEYVKINCKTETTTVSEGESIKKKYDAVSDSFVCCLYFFCLSDNTITSFTARLLLTSNSRNILSAYMY